MAIKDLIMVDELSDDHDKTVSIVMSDSCVLTGNVVNIPLNEALSIVANIALQASLLA